MYIIYIYIYLFIYLTYIYIYLFNIYIYTYSTVLRPCWCGYSNNMQFINHPYFWWLESHPQKWWWLGDGLWHCYINIYSICGTMLLHFRILEFPLMRSLGNGDLNTIEIRMKHAVEFGFKTIENGLSWVKQEP